MVRHLGYVRDPEVGECARRPSLRSRPLCCSFSPANRTRSCAGSSGLLILGACGTKGGDGRTTSQATVDAGGGAAPDARPNIPSVCTLETDGTCTSSDAQVLCCPQSGHPYDFAKACFENTIETVYCAEDRSGLPRCGSPDALGCGATPDGKKAWLMLPGLWQGMEQTKYVSCDEAGLSIFSPSNGAPPMCP